jgi:hypothetical protein
LVRRSGEQVRETVASDGWRAQLFIEQLPQVASVVASMHWTVLEFPDEVLATSDQPVAVLPLLPAHTTAPVAPLPGFTIRLVAPPR